MKLAICTDVYGNLSYTEMLDKVQSLLPTRQDR
jgi:hypothetical protein